MLLRLAWAGTLALTVICLVVGSAALSLAEDLISVARNGLGSTGLVLSTAVVIGVRAAWLPTLALAGATFILGVDYRDVVYGWAIPLRPGEDPLSTILALAVGMVGIALYGFFDVREWD